MHKRHGPVKAMPRHLIVLDSDCIPMAGLCRCVHSEMWELWEALSGFDAMSVAASSYVKKAPKQASFALRVPVLLSSHFGRLLPQVKAPAEMNAPSYEERNPYRLKNNIRAWHTDGSTTSVPEPYGTYHEATGWNRCSCDSAFALCQAQLPRPLLDGFKRAGFQAPTPIQAPPGRIAA